MAPHAWTALVMILALIEETSLSSDIEIEDLPLTRSLGFALNKGVDNLDIAYPNREFAEQYQEMIKASRDSFENIDNLDEKELRRVNREENFEEEAGVLKRRQSTSRIQSAVGRRRSRSQLSRRNKLNSQSLRSHRQHSKHKSTEDDSEQNI